MKYTIYSDMDGVLSDFDKRFMEFSDGVSPKEYKDKNGTKAFWDLIDVQVGVPFCNHGNTNNFAGHPRL